MLRSFGPFRGLSTDRDSQSFGVVESDDYIQFRLGCDEESWTLANPRVFLRLNSYKLAPALALYA